MIRFPSRFPPHSLKFRNAGILRCYSSRPSLFHQSTPSKNFVNNGSVVTTTMFEKSGQDENSMVFPDFNDTATCFQSKTTYELIRAYFIFQICAIRPFVKYSDTLLKIMNAVVGQKITNFMVKKTFFAHFCAGETADDIQIFLNDLKRYGIGGILDYAAENDVEPQDKRDREGVVARTFDYYGEAECDKNVEIFIKCIEAGSRIPESFAAIKITALGKPVLLEKISTVLLGIRQIFKDFSTSSSDGTIDIHDLHKEILQLGVKRNEQEISELFAKFDLNGDGRIDYIDWTQNIKIEDMIDEPNTKEGRTIVAIAKAKGLPLLDSHESKLLHNMVVRVNKVAEQAAIRQVRLMVDAEQTYLQPAIDNLTLDLQRKYNREFPSIFSTYQCYLVWSKSHLLNDLERSKREGWIFAGKLVRGAYMVLEQKRALELGLPNPIFPTIEATHNNYDECVEMVLKNIHRSNIVIASHNQESVEKAIQYMITHGVPRNRVFFGQLLGMSDHLSFTLGMNGYKAFKYVPFGPVQEVIPYLVRRAQENSSLMAGATLQRKMLKDEIKRRLLRQR